MTSAGRDWAMKTGRTVAMDRTTMEEMRIITTVRTFDPRLSRLQVSQKLCIVQYAFNVI